MVRRRALLSSVAAVAAAGVVWSVMPATGQQSTLKGTWVFAELSKTEIKGLVSVSQQRRRELVRVVGSLHGLDRSADYGLVLSRRSCAKTRPGPAVVSYRFVGSAEYFVVGARRTAALSEAKSVRIIEFQDGDDFLLVCGKAHVSKDDSLPPPPPDI
jgi:hypothetical protein